MFVLQKLGSYSALMHLWRLCAGAIYITYIQKHSLVVDDTEELGGRFFSIEPPTIEISNFSAVDKFSL